MIQFLMILFVVYLIMVVYLEYLVAKFYKMFCKDKKSGFVMMLMGYRKKMNCLEKLKQKHQEIQKALYIDNMIKKISLLMLVLVLFVIVTR